MKSIQPLVCSTIAAPGAMRSGSSSTGRGRLHLKGFLFLFFTMFYATAGFTQTPEQVLAANGIVLPAVPVAVGAYTNLVKSGRLIYLSGKGPLQANGTYTTGKVGRELTTAQGYAAARSCAIAQLAVLKAVLGSLSAIKRVVSVTGFVNGTDSFTDQATVLNGCSDLMIEVFGSRGVHARSAIGVASLPFGWPVEIEMILEVDE